MNGLIYQFNAFYVRMEQQKIETSKIGILNFYSLDKDWQKPVITEYQVFKLFKEQQNIPTNYFAFPWATMIDNRRTKKDSALYNLVKKIKIYDKVCFTVIQHIRFREYLKLIKEIGINHVFTPHKTSQDVSLEKKFGIKIISFSLFPIQSNNSNIVDIIDRKYLTCFIGQYKEFYLTSIRQKIFDIFSNYSDCYIKRRYEWHYNGVVYKNQKETNHVYETEYNEKLAHSKFSLCPSGSGANTIRIWESMSFGSIPVILADTLVLPKLKNIDWEDCFIIWKESEIEKLYDYLKSLDS